jgi:hypothetical protein
MKLSLVLAIILGMFSSSLFAGESLSLKLSPPPGWPGGWKTASDHHAEGVQMTELVPANAVVGSVKDIVTVVITRVGSQQEAPFTVTRAWGEHLKTSCPGLSVVPPKPTTEGAFSVAYAQFYCPKRSDNGQGSIDLVKVISADDSTFMVVVAQRTSSFTSAVPGAIQYDKNEDTDAFFEWLKATNDYLHTSARACRKTASDIDECSP